MKWRLIEQQHYSAEMNMAVDHAIYESVAIGRSNPIIRFYKWKNKSVSLGAYQNINDINLEACKKNNVEIVRRMTGGRAVFHDKNDFTYSVIAPIRIYGYSIRSAYKEICSSIINTLKDLGIKSALENKNDIMVDNKKISGNAAKAMDKGIYLQHGTLIYDIDFEVMPMVLNISSDLVKERVTSIVQNKKIDPSKVYEALKRNFTENKDFKAEEITKYEMMRATNLAKARYNKISPPHGSIMRHKGACYVEGGG